MGEATRGGQRPALLDLVVALAVGAAILALTLAAAERSRALGLERREVDDREVLSSVTTQLSARVERDLGSLSSPAASVAIPGITFLLPDGTIAGRAVPTVTEALTDPRIEDVLAQVRDSGVPELAPPVEGTGGPVHLMVAPVYSESPGDQPLLGSVVRRSRLAGWRVAPLALAEELPRWLPRGQVASLRDGNLELSPSGADAAELPAEVVQAGGRRLQVRAGDPSEVPLGPATLGLGLAGAVAGPVAAAALLTASRRRRQQQALLARTAAQVSLVGEVAPLVQQSLDLADVLPAVAVQLVDHFGLAGVRMSRGTSTAGQVELFSIGARPISDSKPVLVPPASLGAGESLTLALQRGGRSVALLQVVAGRSLDETDLQSLRAVTELITAAVVNASLYANQQEALRRLRELDGLKTVFLSTASHELRTPATAIGGFASLLTSSWDRFEEPQRREFVGRIAANAQALGAVVQDLLDFSLLDRGRLHLTVAPIDLAQVVRAVIDRIGPALPDHSLVCRTEQVPLVDADVNAVDRITTNLLTNAAKFSPVGSEVTAEVFPDRDDVVITISDKGPGVPVEERDRIFTRFYRGSGEAVVKTRGVGIGLSVVSELTERLGGTISIDDAPGGGSRFAVRFPASAAVKEAAGA